MADIPEDGATLPIHRVKSIVDKMASQQQTQDEAVQKTLENEKEWKAVVNRMLDTPDGRYFMKYMLRYAKLFAIDNPHYQVLNIETTGKRKVYLELIRPYLDHALRAELENQE